MGGRRVGFVFGVWMVFVFFVAVFGVVLNVPLVWGSGTIYIRADGSIDPPDAPISSVDNVTYTFIDNINDSIVVEKNNITIDGNGYTLQGSGSGTGFTLNSIRNVTIKNTNISNFTFGICFIFSSFNTISGNNITNNNYRGIDLFFSSNNNLTGNNITNNESGIQLIYSSSNMLRGNVMANNKYNFGVFGGGSLSDYVNDVDASNTVDGKPVYYLINRRDVNVPLDAGYVALVNCTRITVQNLNLTLNYEGILLAFTINSTITRNNITNNINGIGLAYSSNNSISLNKITNNGNGIFLQYSSNNNTISGNNITNNESGVILSEVSMFHHSRNNTISGNNITNNDQGIVLLYSGVSYNILLGNNITNNINGITLYQVSHNSIFGNSVTNNNHTAIGLAYHSNDNIIFRNNIIKNGNGFYFSESSNNKLYHNNIINNLQVISYGSTNIWDDDYPSGGNYWSNYEERYPDAEELDGSGIWDTPYVIDENNQDNYPLVNPWGAPTPPTPRTWTVDDDGPADFSKIQDAINAASDGDKIFVREGTYHENTVVNKTVSLIGENRDTTIIDGSGKGTVVSVVVNSVNIRGFTIQNSGGNFPASGIFLNSSGNILSDNNVRNNPFGVFLYHYSSDNTLSANNIIGNYWGGICLSYSSGNTFSNNNVIQNRFGIDLIASSYNTLWGNLMSDNEYNLNVDGGELQHFMHSIDVSNFVNERPVYYLINQKNLVITPLTYPQIGYLAIINSTNITVENMTLTNNGQGILLANTNASSIIANNVANNERGVFLFASSGNTLTENIVVDNSYGIDLLKSHNNTLSTNNIVDNWHIGIDLGVSTNNTMSSNKVINTTYTGIQLLFSPNNVLRSNVMTGNRYNFRIFGAELSHFLNDVDVSNLVEGKPIYYLINQQDLAINPSTFPNIGYLILVNSTNVSVENLTLTSNGQGLLLASMKNSFITGNKVTDNWVGIELWGSSNNKVSGNTVTNNDEGGIELRESSNNTVTGNRVAGTGWAMNFMSPAIKLDFSSHNTVSDNTITNNGYGIKLWYSSNNLIFHNNFVNNRNQTDIYESYNVWDHGYPNGGNYWSDYTDVDEKSGPNQDQPGSDGIGDTPYLIDADNRDRYPLMSPRGDVTPPVTTDDYDRLWHSADFTITLKATDDLIVAETYYKINDGPTQNVSAHGQPLITIESANNMLEYWSVDKAGNEESHHTLTGIKLDKTSPTIGVPSRTPDDDILPEQEVKVSVSVNDVVSGVKSVTLSYTINDGTTWTNLPMNYNPSTTLYEATIPKQRAGTWVKYKIVAQDNAENQATKDGADPYCIYQVIPEFPTWTAILTALSILSATLILLTRKTHPHHHNHG